MKYVIDGRVEDEKAESLINNRAFQFGDGVFETLIVHNGSIRYSKDHYNRLTKALSSISLNSELLQYNVFEFNIHSALEANGLQSARVKYLVYRKSSESSGYKTNTNGIESCVISKPLNNPQISIHNQTSFSEVVNLNYSSYSAYKTISSLPYVLAEIEKSDRGLDELVLLDTNQNVSECCSSNIFWINDNELFTSPLTTGCKAGIIRQLIMKSHKVTEVTIKYDELKKAEVIFCTNIAKLGIFAKIDNHELTVNHAIIDQIKPLWEL